MVKETCFAEELHNMLSYEWPWQRTFKPPLWSVHCHTFSYSNYITVVPTWYSHKKLWASMCVYKSKAGSRNKVKSLAMAISHSLIKMCDFKSCCRKRSCPKSAKANEININNLFLLVNSAFLVKCFQILLCDKENILFVCDVGVYLHVEQGSEIRSDLKRSGDTQTSESTQAHHTTTRNQTLQLFF